MDRLNKDGSATVRHVPVIHIIERSTESAACIQRLLESCGLKPVCCASPIEFLASFDSDSSGCILAEADLPGMSGLDLLSKLQSEGVNTPVILLVPRGDVCASVRAMKAGAIDVFEESTGEYLLLEAIRKAIDIHERMRQQWEGARRIRRRLERLSLRERQVLTLILAGRSTKEIAAELCLSPKTIENHRTSIMRKTEMTGAVDLVREVLLSARTEGYGLAARPVDRWAGMINRQPLALAF